MGTAVLAGNYASALSNYATVLGGFQSKVASRFGTILGMLHDRQAGLHVHLCCK